MRIRRIALRDFGGVDEAEVTFPADGITVIEGENEAGKSTLLRALDAILEYPDSSTRSEIRDLVPVGRDVGPQVEVDLETGDYLFTYRKRWIRDRETVLEITRPSREQLTGREAHDRVTEILQETLDIDLWEALRLEQGTAITRAVFSGSSLGRALDAVSGGDVAGEEEDALWDRIEAEYGRYWTKTGKPRGDHASAQSELAAAREAAEAATAHVQALDDDAVEVERMAAQQTALEEDLEETGRVVGELEEQHEEITRIRQDLEAATAELSRARATLDAARSEQERRAEQVEQVRVTEEALAGIERDVAGAEPAREGAAAAVAEADAQLASARATLAEAEQRYERARSDAEFRRWEIEVAQLEARLERVGEAQEQLAEATATIDEIAVDDELLGEIEQAYLRVVELRAAVERALPVVRIEALRDVNVVLDGVEDHMGEGETREVTTHGRTEVVVPGTVEVVVTAGTEGADVVEEFEHAEASLSALCDRAGVADFADARARFDRKVDAERTRAAANETIKRDLADLTLADLTHKVESLTSRIDAYRASRGTEPPMPDDHSAAQEAEAHARRILDEARTAFDQAVERADAARERLTELDRETAGREGKLEIARNAVASARKVLDEAREVRADEEIETAVADATTAVESAHERVAGLEERLQSLDAERLEALLENARARRERSRRDLAEVAGRRKELEIRLALETERGPARLVDEAQTRLVEAERRHEAISRRAAAVALLRETFDRHRLEARRRYVRPFRDEIERLGRIVYGATFEVGLDEDLAIETRTLDGETLRYDQLSTGAQEQLGVLARLACARLVSRDGGAPVVLDDALGWTDPERLDLMGAAISTAADECQVIILTCVPDRYASVGKARTVRI